MNSPRNEAVRLEMLKGAHLVSAIRLPNNLFADHAGTEVGSDLVVLQKDTRKEGLTEDEKLFIQTGIQNGVSTNRYFIEHGEQIVHTSAKLDTDPYGKPAMVYQHDGGVEGIATQLRELLDDNLHVRLVMRLYSGGIRDVRLQEQQTKAQTTDTPLRTELTAEDLAAFGAWAKEKSNGCGRNDRQRQPISRGRPSSKRRYNRRAPQSGRKRNGLPYLPKRRSPKSSLRS